MKKPVMFWIEESRKKEMVALAHQSGRSLSEMLRCAVDEYCATRETEEKRSVKKTGGKMR